MATETSTRPGRKRALSREQIVATALEILRKPDAEFNLRTLGEHLGVTHPTLYTYFDGRDELMHAIVAELLNGLPRVTAAEPRLVRAQLHEQLQAMRELFARHRALTESVGSKSEETPFMSWGEDFVGQTIQALVTCGIDPKQAGTAYLGLVLSAVGSAIATKASAASRSKQPSAEAQHRYPALSELDSINSADTLPQIFESVLDTMIDGLFPELK